MYTLWVWWVSPPYVHPVGMVGISRIYTRGYKVYPRIYTRGYERCTLLVCTRAPWWVYQPPYHGVYYTTLGIPHSPGPGLYDEGCGTVGCDEALGSSWEKPVGGSLPPSLKS